MKSLVSHHALRRFVWSAILVGKKVNPHAFNTIRFVDSQYISRAFVVVYCKVVVGVACHQEI